MDENKPRRRWLSFGIRDLLWAMVVVGLVIGWRQDHRNQVAQFWDLREAISNSHYRVSVDSGKYYIEPMSPNEVDRHHRRKERKR
jgi:hypothetical protein